MYLAMLKINCLVFLQIIFLFCLNYDEIQQIFRDLMDYHDKILFCSVKTIKE